MTRGGGGGDGQGTGGPSTEGARLFIANTRGGGGGVAGGYTVEKAKKMQKTHKRKGFGKK